MFRWRTVASIRERLNRAPLCSIEIVAQCYPLTDPLKRETR